MPNVHIDFPRIPTMKIELDWMPPSALALLVFALREASHETMTPEIEEEWLILSQEVEAALASNNGHTPESMMPAVAKALPHIADLHSADGNPIKFD